MVAASGDHAARGANVVLVVLDDVGFAQLGCYRLLGAAPSAFRV